MRGVSIEGRSRGYVGLRDRLVFSLRGEWGSSLIKVEEYVFRVFEVLLYNGYVG